MAPLYTLHTIGDSVLTSRVGTDGACSTWMAVWALNLPWRHRYRTVCPLANLSRLESEQSLLPLDERGLPWGCWLGMLAGDAAGVQEERVRHRQGRCHWRRFLVGQSFGTVSRKRQVPLDGNFSGILRLCLGWILATQWSMMSRSVSPMKRALASRDISQKLYGAVSHAMVKVRTTCSITLLQRSHSSDLAFASRTTFA